MEKEYQGYFADCYVLVPYRTKGFIHSFLDHFIPDWVESAEEYEIPQYSGDPIAVFESASGLIDYLVKKPDEHHSIYWRNTGKSEIRGAMCFFTNDGYVIAGLYCETTFPDTTIEDNLLFDLKKFCKSDSGFITYEEPPPQNAIDFLKRVKATNNESERRKKQ